MIQNPAKRHHWIPQFVLRRWCASDGKLRCWKREAGVLTEFRPTPDDVMFKKHLYSAKHAANPAMIEDAFRELENIAAQALVKIADPSGPELDLEEKGAWAAFLLAMRLRVPDVVARSKKRIQATFDADFGKPDPEFDAVNTNPEFKTAADYLASVLPGFREDGHLRAMIKFISDPEQVRRVGSLRWFARREMTVPLLLGDRPLSVGGDRDDGTFYMAMPVSPSTLFYATANRGAIKKIQSLPDKELAKRVNLDQAAQAHRLIIGDVQPRFLEKWFLKG